MAAQSASRGSVPYARLPASPSRAAQNASATGAIVFGFGTLFFLWMLGSLRAVLMAAEGGSGRLAAIGFASGVAVSIALTFAYLPHAQAAFDHANTSDTSIDALVRTGDAFFGGAVLFSIPMLVATALAILRFGSVPRWLAWSASSSRW